jgi:hypothetical protein
MGNLHHTVQGQSPDTNKPGKQSDKICFHSDKWDMEALLQVRTLTGVGLPRSGKRSEFITLSCIA